MYMLRAIIVVLGATCVAQAAEIDPKVKVGERLFSDTRFSNPAGDLETSCASCHTKVDPLGPRAFTELLSLSWHPWRDEDPGRETLRNTTMLMDLEAHPLIHYDGEFATLDDQAEQTLIGRNLGWLPGETDQAFAHIRAELKADGQYAGEFLAAYGSDPSKLDNENMVRVMGVAIADFVRTLKTDFDSPYDLFVKTNHIEELPGIGEAPKDYGTRVLKLLEDLDKQSILVMTTGFGEQELEGYKIFLRSKGTAQAGNCVACHVPPLFSDFQFRNTGMAQMDYDRFNGDGAFAKLDIPGYADAERPAKPFFTRSSRSRIGVADLGHWNFADPGTSPIHEKDMSNNAFLEKTIGTFKTPSLRHLGSTDPYMHTGEFITLEGALGQKIHASFLARMGQLRNGHEEMKNVHVLHSDIPALFAFLNSLNDKADQTKVYTHIPRSLSSGGTGQYTRY